MAGEWIKFELATATKPEVFKAARILGIEPDAVVGKLIRLWAWFDVNSVDGSVDGVVSTDVDAVCKQVGFCAALAHVGWIAYDDAAERVSLPNFDRHNGESAKKRALKNERQSRWRKNVDAPVDAEASTPVSTPASTKASTREEKSLKAKAPAAPSAGDRRADLFFRWKQVAGESGGAFLGKLLKDHKPESRVLAAVEETLSAPRADVKGYVVRLLNKAAAVEDVADAELARAI